MEIRVLKIINGVFVIPICLFVVGCYFNSTYNNREIDRKHGEEVVAQFYELVKNKNYQEVYKYFSKRFFEVTDTQKLNYIFDIASEKLGDIESFNVERWETQAVVGTNPKTDYFFLCDVKRLNFVSKETFMLTKEKDEIKIIGYQVSSEQFFMEE
jgi:hypothetical protein